jgi:uncharacterized protein YutD
MRATLVSIIILVLIGCTDSEQENSQRRHIKEYYSKVAQALKDYAKQSRVNGKVDGVYKAHLVILDTLKKEKKHFSQYKEEERLQTVVELYDYALSHLLQKRVKILELSKRDNPTSAQPILKKIKDFGYYREYRERSGNLLAMLKEHKAVIMEHHEVVRKKLLGANLTKSEREQIWPDLNNIIAGYVHSVSPELNMVIKNMEMDIEIAELLHENKDSYFVETGGTMRFNTTDLLNQYKNILDNYGFSQLNTAHLRALDE